MKVNFAKLKKVIICPEAKVRCGNESSEALSEFTAFLTNYIQHAHEIKEEELAMLIMSMQNWVIRRNYTTCKVPVRVGDIFFADLGNNYKPEFAYPHPVLILEKIGGLYLIVPTSTSPNLIQNAYHPIEQKDGMHFLRKVKQEDGFEQDCVLLLSNIRTISPGRLLEKKGRIHSVFGQDSLLQEIKMQAMQLCFPKQYLEFQKLKEQCAKLEEKVHLLDKKS